MRFGCSLVFPFLLIVLAPRFDCEAQTLHRSVTNSIGMKLKRIKAGGFPMGNPVREEQQRDYPEHLVRITQDFYLGATEVTQQQWEAVMGTRPWKDKPWSREGANFPATRVSWDDAVQFCRRLSELEGVTYRLPTEAEWEYACPAGTTTNYSCGDDFNALKDHAWFFANANDVGEKYAHQVGTKLPNRWGLYDMHGNVREWCQDRYGRYPNSAVVDPNGPLNGSYRVIRGGSWYDTAKFCLSSSRYYFHPSVNPFTIGFRVARGPWDKPSSK
jgi:formylglycine-generating enzyme required for sulfatase activity